MNIKIKMKRRIRRGDMIEFVWIDECLYSHFDPYSIHKHFSMGKAYMLSSDKTLHVEKDDMGGSNGWSSIYYNPATGMCLSRDGSVHYATIKLVEDADKSKG